MGYGLLRYYGLWSAFPCEPTWWTQKGMGYCSITTVGSLIWTNLVAEEADKFYFDLRWFLNPRIFWPLHVTWTYSCNSIVYGGMGYEGYGLRGSWLYMVRESECFKGNILSNCHLWGQCSLCHPRAVVVVHICSVCIWQKLSHTCSTWTTYFIVI